MEKKEPHLLEPYERIKIHKKLMVNILKNLTDTPLVLKGGTALYLAYGLPRFSEDLDFDSSKKLNLLSKIKNSAPSELIINNINLKKDTFTVSRYLISYTIKNSAHTDSLKLEISYRKPVPDNQITIIEGIRYASIERIIDNKLNAAFDGENTRTKARDLFDLHFLAKNYSNHFNVFTAERLAQFSDQPHKLIDLYIDDIESDALLNKIMDIEVISLELHEMSSKIFEKFLDLKR